MVATGAYMIKETELVDAIGAAVGISTASKSKTDGPLSIAPTVSFRNNFVLGLASSTPLSSPQNRPIWKKDMRMAVYQNINTGESAAGGSSGILRSFLADVRHDAARLKAAETPAVLAQEIGKKLFELVLRPEEEINTSAGLADLGMDSLVAIEMRSWWCATFGFNISVLELLGMGSLDALAAHAVEGLLKAMVVDS